MKIFFLIDKLNRGGAERQLIELVKNLDKKYFDITVIIFNKGGELLPELKTVHNIRTISLNRKKNLALFFIELLKITRKLKPDVLHGYMGGTNELCLILGKILNIKVVWGIRASDMNLANYGRIAKVSFKLGAWLSYFVDLIIANSMAGKAHYVKNGYSKKMVVIPNGIDTKHFFHKPEAGKQIRSELGIDNNVFLIGLVGRIDPMKDHTTFIKAATEIIKNRNNVYFMCVGDGHDPYKTKIQLLGKHAGLNEKLIWTGTRNDLFNIYNSLDIAISSSSYGEGFSNVISEAMSCGLPCIVTDVGDSAYIVGDAGIVVPCKNPEALSNAIEYILDLPDNKRLTLCNAARRRIVKHFELDKLASRVSIFLRVLLS